MPLAINGQSFMKLIILLIFIALPIAEIAVLIRVGEAIGILPTVALVILTAVIGVALLKRQGLATLARAQQTVEAGEVPVDSVIEGICLLVAGAFLLAPGLITDTLGFLLLVPPVRHTIAHWMAGRIKESGSINIWTSGTHPPRGGGRGGPRTIDGEYEDVTPERPDKPADKRLPPGESNPDSPWRQ